MNPFTYQKVKHARTQEPGNLSPYTKYKPFLRSEFSKKCVYCRVPDTLRGADNFGVDHYRPKKQFPELGRTYSNLFYCCNQCNRRKGAYWPPPGKEQERFIPNPCDHVMFSHLQYHEGTVRSKSTAGAFTVEHLDLNDQSSVEQRALIIRMIDLARTKLAEFDESIERLRTLRDSGNVDHAAAGSAIDALRSKRDLIDSDVRRLSGE